MGLRDYTTMSFDVYGTLIDWESGILGHLRPWLKGVPNSDILSAYGALENEWQMREPGMLYPEILTRVHGDLGKRFGFESRRRDAEAFAASIGDWLPFPDSTESLRHLKRHHRLVILSNVDEASIARSIRRIGVEFDQVLTAEAIGSYKPARANFERLLAAAEGKLLHIAESLYHDHTPCNALGIASAWINRRHGMTGCGATRQPDSMPRTDYIFPSLAALCQAHQEQSA